MYRLTALHILRMATEIFTNYEACPGEILLTETSDTHSFVNIPILDSLCLYLWQDAEQIIWLRPCSLLPAQGIGYKAIIPLLPAR